MTVIIWLQLIIIVLLIGITGITDKIVKDVEKKTK
jgi:hypothetical protein